MTSTLHQPRPETEPATAEILVYNTLTRRKERLQTIEPGKVRMYVCGVTPYDSAHVGHGMSLISFDVIRRYTVAQSATWTQPTISGNRLYIKDVSTLALWTLD